MSTDRITVAAADRFATARAVADAVLYEGYVLYPYRASARKNQIRWQFGVLAPKAFSEAQHSERWTMRTECIVDPGASPVLTVRIRCLQVQRRTVQARRNGEFVTVDRLDLDGAVYVPWDEAVEHNVDLPAIALLPLGDAATAVGIDLDGGEDTESIIDAKGKTVGRLLRNRDSVEGRALVTASWADGPGALMKVSVVVENVSDTGPDAALRDDILTRSFIAVHTMLAVDGGAFVSLLDPPEDARDAAAGCRNDGTFPVLIGDHDVMLSSPIILYDHPAVAPESPGDLYDSTEIDEILALRILTLTDDEKAEARGTDPRAAAIIDRCDDMPPELWARLHGAVRTIEPVSEVPKPLPWWDPTVDASFDPWSDRLVIAGVEVAKGTKVRLRPSRRADAHDIFLAGQEATIAGVHDVDDDAHVAVTLDDDPATEEFAWQGRYLFFHPDEIELIAPPGSGPTEGDSR